MDSYLNPDSVNSIIVPITNVMNDQYCYQTSKKIRQVFDYKRRNGQYIGSFAPYGYIKDPKDKHQLIMDTNAAEIVKCVYSMLLQDLSIALYLNEHGIPSPTAYRRVKSYKVHQIEAVPEEEWVRVPDTHEAIITRSQSGKNIYYACSTYKNRSWTACSMHSIKHNRLEVAVLFAIQYQVNTAVSYSALTRNIPRW